MPTPVLRTSPPSALMPPIKRRAPLLHPTNSPFTSTLGPLPISRHLAKTSSRCGRLPPVPLRVSEGLRSLTPASGRYAYASLMALGSFSLTFCSFPQRRFALSQSVQSRGIPKLSPISTMPLAGSHLNLPAPSLPGELCFPRLVSTLSPFMPHKPITHTPFIALLTLKPGTAALARLTTKASPAWLAKARSTVCHPHSPTPKCLNANLVSSENRPGPSYRRQGEERRVMGTAQRDPWG
jgi:hypothetical protein